MRNGGAGVYVQHPGGGEEKIWLATGLYSTSYRAEPAAHIQLSPYASPYAVFLTGAPSIFSPTEIQNSTTSYPAVDPPPPLQPNCCLPGKGRHYKGSDGQIYQLL